MIDTTTWGFPEGTLFEILPEATEGERAMYARSQWLPGPWCEEPADKITWVDNKTGLDCLMVRGPMGSWCGYVGVPASHPLHGIEYNGCVNRHVAKSYEQKLQEAQEWLEAAVKAEHDAAEKGEDHHSTVRLAELRLQSLQNKESFFASHGEWDCTSWNRGDSERCKTPESLLSAHGGITYSGACQGKICHHIEGRPDVWWFGMDFAHSMDVVPGMLASSKQMRKKGHDIFDEHLTYDPVTGTNSKYGDTQVYRRVPYVKREVEKLAVQLKALERPA